MNAREPAWRLFAGEFNASSIEHTTDEEYAPVYVVTPLGAFVNRLFVVGVLTEKSNVGSMDEPLWRARISDPTGVFYISAGQYQPEAARRLEQLEPPVYVAVSGKARTYSPEEGLLYVSLRPEMIKPVNEELYYYWVLETCLAMKERIDAMAEVQKMAEPTLEECDALGISERIANGLIFARENYGNVDLERYIYMVHDAFDMVKRPEPDLEAQPAGAPATGGARGAAPPSPSGQGVEPPSTSGPDTLFSPPAAPFSEKGVGGDSEPTTPPSTGQPVPEPPTGLEYPSGFRSGDEAPDSAAEKQAQQPPADPEDAVLEIIERLDQSTKGADYQQITREAKKRHIDQGTLEELLRSLQEKGAIYEPTLGYIKLVPP